MLHLLAVVFITGFEENDFVCFTRLECIEGWLEALCVCVLSHGSSVVFHPLPLRPVSLMALIAGKFVRSMSGDEIQLGTCV